MTCIGTEDQLADMLTKPLLRPCLVDLRERIVLCPCLPRSTVVALRGLGAGRQSRLHLRVVHILAVLFGSSRKTVAWLNGNAPRLNMAQLLFSTYCS